MASRGLRRDYQYLEDWGETTSIWVNGSAESSRGQASGLMLWLILDVLGQFCSLLSFCRPLLSSIEDVAGVH